MSDLTTFRDHCRAMADPARHLPDCDSLKPAVSAWEARFLQVDPFLPPACDGCIPEQERARWGRLADEIDGYLARDPEIVDEAPPAESGPGLF